MEYVSVKVPKVFGDQIDQLLEAGYYASRAEFVKDAVRRLLENIPTPQEATA